MELFLIEIIYNSGRSTKQARLVFGVDNVLIKREAFILITDRVPEELSASTKCLSEGREGFIEVYIDNQ
jgi:hypothetical protein